MGQTIEIRVPDIGDFEDVEVVEILVSAGDAVELDDPLVSVESDKATMEIPATEAGVVAEVRVAEGDRVSEGSVLVLLDAEGAADGADDEAGAAEPDDASSEAEQAAAPSDEAKPPDDASGQDGSQSTDDAPEQDGSQSTDDAPEQDGSQSRDDAPAARADDAPAAATDDEAASSADAGQSASGGSAATARSMSAAARDPVPDRPGVPHASPLVRRYARELGVPVESTEGSGPHGRVLVEDLKQRVRERFSDEAAAASESGGSVVPAMPTVDHAAHGPVHEEPLTRIQRVAGPALHRSWLNVPHVTQHDEADVTELERFRRERRRDAEARGVRLSPLLFVMKAVCLVLREFPKFRASLAPEGDRLIVKDSIHLGVAVDTEQGLVVPVIRDVDRKGVFELAAEVAETAERARSRKLGPDDLAGAVFTISSLGGIGGTQFTPIVNAPEVAILGLSRTALRPRWTGADPFAAPSEAAASGAAGADPAAPGRETPAGGHFEPRLVLPFSLSYDHRVIDGADGARFTTRLAGVLEDPMRLLL